MKSILRRLMTALFGFSLVVYILHYSVRGDTVALLKQVDHLIACVAHGQWSGWGGHFPLLQKLPAIAFRLLGWKDDQILEGLVALNLLSFVLMLMCSWRLLCSRSRRVAIFFSAVLCSGPLLWYAHVTFGESFAAFATLAFTVACLQKARGWKIALLLVFAGISKDVATPFLLFLGGTALCLNLQPSGGFTLAPSWRQIRPLAMGAALALATNVAFNYLRYGGPINTELMNPLFRVHDWRTHTSFFFGIFASPNGGLLFFWPSWILLVVAIAASIWKNWRKGIEPRTTLISVVPSLGFALILFGLVWGFSSWSFPLGWVGWGPRFLLPWLPSMALLLTVAHVHEFDELLQSIVRSGWRLWSMALSMAVVSLPQFAVLFRPSLLESLFMPDKVCPRTPYITAEPAYYFNCMHHILWTKRSTLLDAFAIADQPFGFFLSVACSILLVAFLLSSRDSRPCRPSDDLPLANG